MNDTVWDSNYHKMYAGFEDQSSWPFLEALDDVMSCPEVMQAYQDMRNQEGQHSLVFMQDNFKHKCAKAYANMCEVEYEY